MGTVGTPCTPGRRGYLPEGLAHHGVVADVWTLDEEGAVDGVPVGPALALGSAAKARSVRARESSGAGSGDVNLEPVLVREPVDLLPGPVAPDVLPARLRQGAGLSSNGDHLISTQPPSFASSSSKPMT